MKALFTNSQIVMLVSHDTDKIIDLCNRVLVLHKGEVINDGSPKEMVDYYLKEIVN